MAPYCQHFAGSRGDLFSSAGGMLLQRGGGRKLEGSEEEEGPLQNSLEREKGLNAPRQVRHRPGEPVSQQ